LIEAEEGTKELLEEELITRKLTVSHHQFVAVPNYIIVPNSEKKKARRKKHIALC